MKAPLALAGCLLTTITTAAASTTNVALSLAGGAAATGGTITLNLSQATTVASGDTTPTPAALQWNTTFSPVDFSGLPQVAVGPSATAAGKSVQCASNAPGTMICIIFGLNQNVIADGVVASITLTVQPGSPSIQSPVGISGTVMASPAGTLIPSTGAGGLLAILQIPSLLTSSQE